MRSTRGVARDHRDAAVHRRFTISLFGLSAVPSLESRASYTLKRPDQNRRRLPGSADLK
jgi:hypothetical protein